MLPVEPCPEPSAIGHFAADEELWPCVGNCGFLAATGRDRSGFPYSHCCRSCALGQGHDSKCAKILCLDVEDSLTGSVPSLEPPLSPPRPLAAASMPPPPQPPRPLVGRHRELCRMGCGLPVARGHDWRGQPWTACCRACASGEGRHDELCGQEVVSRPVRMSRRLLQPSLWDPIWGEVELKRMKPDESPTVRRRCGVHCFAFCPCLVVTLGCLEGEVWTGLSKAEVRLAWKRLLLSWSMFFSVIQVLVLLAPLLFFDGYVDFATNPMGGPSFLTLEKMGAKNSAKIVYGNQWWRLFSPILLHAGWIHLLGNLSLQLRTGLVLESLWGHGPFLMIYLLSGAYGSLCSALFQSDALSVGASGSLCGLLGAWGPFIVITWNQTLPKDRRARNSQLCMALSTAVAMIPLSFLPMVDWSAHLGGLAMGVALAMVVFGQRLQSNIWSIGTRTIGALSVVVLVLLATWQLLQTEPPEFLLHL